MAVRFNASIVNQIQQANDIVDLVSEHVSLAKKGREMVALCPFHEDHRPSMYVSPAKQIFKCFACGAGGDVFKFVQMRENLTFPQAVERLAQRVGIKLEETRPRPRADDEAPEIDPNTLAKVNEWAAKVFEANLRDESKGAEARAYTAERKIDPEVARKWRLGLAGSDNDLLSQAKAKKASLQLLSAAGLLTGGGVHLADKFSNRLMFAITDVSGRVIAFGGRTLDGEGAKYINSPTTPLFDKSNCLYGLEHARRDIASSGVAVVVEGYTDCMMAHQFGCRNVVATLGTSFTAGHARMLRRYANRVVLIYDSDVAGIEAANRAMEVCLSQRVDIKIASVPQGKDPCDFLLAAGSEAFEKLISEAEDVFEFKWKRLSESLSADLTLAERKRAVDDFLHSIAAAANAGNITTIERGLLVNRLSKILGVESAHINRELSQTIQKVQRNASYAAKNQSVRKVELAGGLLVNAQREILEVLLNAPKLFEGVPETITPAGFENPVLKQAAEVIFAAARSTDDLSLTSVLAATESVEAGNAIVEMAEAGERKANFESRLKGAIAAIERIEARNKAANIRQAGDHDALLRQKDRQNPRALGMV